MAKKSVSKRKKKRNRQPETKVQKKPGKKGIEAVGWGFWLICFALLFGPCWYLGYTISIGDRKTSLLPWVIGFSLAALAAGLLSWVANFVVHKRNELRRKRAGKGE